MSRIAVGVTHYNRPTMLKTYIADVLVAAEQSGHDVSVFVYDDSSHPDNWDPEWMDDIPGVEYYQSDENGGLGHSLSNWTRCNNPRP